MQYYIYKIENLVNHKKYIGLTNNVARRRARHFTDLRCHRHDNHFMQKEFDIYGEDNFSFEVIFNGDLTDSEIGDKEKEYIVFYDSYRNGYNQNEGGNFGASNGGTTLTQSDVYNILAALEFESRPGQALADMFDVSRTTISRIKRGVNHNQYKDEYEALPLEERQHIYKIFCDSTNFAEKKANSSKLVTKRRLTEQQVHLVFLNEELGRPVPIVDMMKICDVSSSNTIYCILKGDTYKDYAITYNKLTKVQKDELATLLSN